MQYEVKKIDGSVAFIAEIDCPVDATEGEKLGLSVHWGHANGKGLRELNCNGAIFRELEFHGATFDRSTFEDSTFFCTTFEGTTFDEYTLKTLPDHIIDKLNLN